MKNDIQTPRRTAMEVSIIKDHTHGVPDIIIEILSEGNKNYDLIRKKNCMRDLA